MTATRAALLLYVATVLLGCESDGGDRSGSSPSPKDPHGLGCPCNEESPCEVGYCPFFHSVCWTDSAFACATSADCGCAAVCAVGTHAETGETIRACATPCVIQADCPPRTTCLEKTPGQRWCY